MSVTIRGAAALIEPQLPNGQPNPLFGLAAYLAVRATGRDNDINVDVVNGEAVISGITDVDSIKLTTLQGLVAYGAEVYGYQVWIERTAEQMAAEVPAYLPNRLDDSEAVRKWSDWHDDSHEPMTIGDVTYVPGDAFSQEIPGSVIAQLLANGVTVKTLSEMRAIIAENAPSEP